MLTTDVLVSLRSGATIPMIAHDLGLPVPLVRATAEQLVRLGLAHRAHGCGSENGPCGSSQKANPAGPERVPLACRGCPFAGNGPLAAR